MPLAAAILDILAAGDVRSGATKRVGFAVGDGALAVTCTHRLRSMIDSPKVAPPPANNIGVIPRAAAAVAAI